MAPRIWIETQGGRLNTVDEWLSPVRAQNPGYRIIRFGDGDCMEWSLACHARYSGGIVTLHPRQVLGGSMKRLIEIRAAEGGEDSKLFVMDLAQAYQRHCDRVG